MKRLNVFILTCTLLIICGFLPADASLDFPDSAGVVNSQIVVYIFYQFEYYSEEIDINITLSYDPEFLTINSSTGNKGVKASVEETLTEVDHSVTGKIQLTLNETICDCPFSYYSITFNTLKTGYTSITGSSITHPDLFQSDNVEVNIVNHGDVNGDGSIDIIDALLIAQKYTGRNVHPFIEPAADVNCDQVIDIIDALLIARLFAYLIMEFPLCPDTIPLIQPTIVPSVKPDSCISLICGGDVNGDGNRDIIDSLLLHRFMVGWITPGFIEEEADVNGDGIVNSSDACLICYYE